MKAVIFCRVSSDKQEDGHSLETQMHINMEYARKHSFEVIKEVSIVESSMGDRPKFYDMIDFIKKSKEKKFVLICHCIDRLHRDFGAMECVNKLRKEGKVDIHFTKDGSILNKNSNSSELFRYGLDVLIGNDSSNRTGERVKTIFDRKREDGVICGPAPLGYLNKERKHEKKKEKREPADVYIDPDRGHFVKQIFEEYSNGSSMQTARQKAIREGFRTKAGVKPSISTIENMLKNPFYCGYMYSKLYNTIAPHNYPRLITKDLFDRCQDIRDGKRRVRPKSETIQKFTLGKCLIKCHHCGCSYSPEIKKGKYIYMRPTKTKGECIYCVQVTEKIILSQIGDILKDMHIPEDMLNDVKKKLKELVDDKYRSNIKDLKKLADRQLQIDEDLKKLRHKSIHMTIGSDEYTDNEQTKKELHEEKHQVEAKLQQLNQSDKTFETTMSTVLDIASRAYEIFKSSEMDRKRRIIEMLFPNLVMDSKKLVFTVRKPFNMILENDGNLVWLPSFNIFRNKQDDILSTMNRPMMEGVRLCLVA